MCINEEYIRSFRSEQERQPDVNRSHHMEAVAWNSVCDLTGQNIVGVHVHQWYGSVLACLNSPADAWIRQPSYRALVTNMFKLPTIHIHLTSGSFANKVAT